jgi:regulator of CtrA degradation
MSEFGPEAVALVRAGVVQDFARSELFARTFQDGMDLVEEVAAYLDGPGRQDSKLLSRQGALAYAAESMRLTTRLMQVASWLLVQRAVREGDMTAMEACQPRYRIPGDKAPGEKTGETAADADVPAALTGLSDRARRLYERVVHLDQRMYMDAPAEAADHPVLAQHDRLRAAFDAA